MNAVKQKMILAEETAKELFHTVEKQGLITPGKSESTLSDELVRIAKERFGIDNFWHKKIVRAGVNTLCPYSANPHDVIIQDDDLVILDFGPVFDGYEADIGRTYVLGHDPLKLKLKNDVETAWNEANAWYARQTRLTGSAYFHYLHTLAKKYGWDYAGDIGGHIVGPFPHEQLGAGDLGLDIHPDNHADIFQKDPLGNDRHWILEIHFVDRVKKIGAYFEQLITPP